MICVECGAEEEALIGGSCAACFAGKHDLVALPDVVQVELCSHCGARRVGAHWMEPEADTPETWVLEDAVRAAAMVHQEVQDAALAIDLTPKDQRTFQVVLSLEGAVGDVQVQDRRQALLRRTKAVCDRCSRIQGGYYAAIIQVRASDRPMEPDELQEAHGTVGAELDRLLATGNRFAFLSKSEPVHGGFDYYIGDIEAGRNVARRLRDRLGASISESAKLVGRREGENVYRVTFLVRLAPFSRGDVVQQDDTPHYVLQVHPRTLTTLDLLHQRRGRIGETGLRRLGGREMVQDAVVVSRGADGVLVIDPRTQRTETILVPDDASVGATVPVVRVDERLYWVPAPPRSTNNP